MQRAAIGLALVGALGLGVMRLGAQDVPDKKLESILKDTRIWGKHFAEVLAAMPAWSETGEEQIVVFQQRVEGSREFRSATEARKADTETRATRKKRWVPVPAFADMLGPVMNRPLVRIPASPKTASDGESVHLAWANQRELLAPNLTKAQLIEALGQPESVVRRLQPTEDERRPVALTEFRYANTTAVFAQPDYAPKPGIIDRAVLKCTPVVNTVFRP